MAAVGENPKTVNYRERLTCPMRSWTSQALIERLVTGDRCEVKGCYELAIWLISFNDETTHWCARHTRTRMRDVNHWSELLRTKLA